jgi:cytochrome c biogenesis protein CcmG, thiol:disulfide interchange protein DsbE
VSRWLLGGLAVVAVVVLVAAFYPNQDRSDQGPLDMVGSRLPAITLPAVHGTQLDTATLTGRPVLVNIWATWCGPCRREMPALTLLSHRMGPGFTIIAIDQGEDASVVNAYVKQFGVDFPVYLDPEQRMGTMLHLVGLPSSFFVDRNGVVKDAVDGEMTYQMMTDKAHQLVTGG